MCFGLRGVNAQTDTPTPTITRTPTNTPAFGTFTPVAATETPVGDRFDCPDEPVYSNDVALSYLVQCGHCVTEVTATPRQVSSGGLPSVGLPITPLFTASPTPTGIWFPVTMTPDPNLTQYPTITPEWFVSPTATSAFTSTPAPTSTPQPQRQVIDWLWNGDYDFEIVVSHGTFEHGVNGEVYEWVTNVSDQPAFFIVFDEEVFVHDITLSYDLSCSSGGCTNDISLEHWQDGLTNGIEDGFAWCNAQHAAENSDPTTHCYPRPLAQSQDDLPYDSDNVVGITHNIGRSVKEVFLGHASYGSGVFAPGWMSNLTVDYEPLVVIEITPTPTPFVTMTAAPYVDCRNPESAEDDTQLAETDALSGGLVAISRTCFTFIDPSFRVDLRFINPDFLLDPDDVEICIVVYQLPSFSLFGIPLPLDMVLSVMIIAYVVRTLRSY